MKKHLLLAICALFLATVANGTGIILPAAGGGNTDLTGLGADNNLARWDGTDTIQDSACSVSDSGLLSCTDITASGQIYSAQDTETQAASSAHTISWADGNSTVWDLEAATGNITLTLSNGVAGASYIIKIIQGSTARDVTWPASVKWPGGVAPVISTGENDVDIVSLYFDGTSYYGTYGQDFQ